jgi:multimeric flavodoxin WrbA
MLWEKDEMNSFIQKMLEADGILLGFPYLFL